MRVHADGRVFYVDHGKTLDCSSLYLGAGR